MNQPAAGQNDIFTEEEAQAYRDEVIASEWGDDDAGRDYPPDSDHLYDARIDDDAAAADAAELNPGPGATDDDAADPWAGVNPALKTMFDDMSGKLEDSEGRLKQAERRIGSLTNDLHNAQQAVANVDDAPSKAQVAEASQTLEKWEELKADYPEWGEAVEELVNAHKGAGGISKEQMDAELTNLRDSMEGQTQSKIEVAVLRFAYPDYQKTIDSKDYQQWLEKQDENLKVKVRSTSANDAIEVLDAYHDFKDPQPKPKKLTAAQIARQRRSRLKSSSETPGRHGVPTKTEEDMSEDELRQKIGREVWAE